MKALRRKRPFEEDFESEPLSWNDRFSRSISKDAPVLLDPYCLFLNFATGAWVLLDEVKKVPKPLTFFSAKHIEASHRDYKSLVKDFKYPFVVRHILEIENPFVNEAFQLKAKQISMKTEPNIAVLWHCSTLESLGSMLNNGMDVKFSSIGSFGTALYFADCVEKANIYSDGKEDPKRLRVMLRCQVILGKSKQFPHGMKDTNRITNEAGFDSVQGEPRFCREYAIYNNNQVRITHVFLYHFVDPSMEMDYEGNFIDGLMGNAFTSYAPNFFPTKIGAKAELISPFVLQPFYIQPKRFFSFRKPKNTPIETLQKEQLPLHLNIVPPHQILKITKKISLPSFIRDFFNTLRQHPMAMNCKTTINTLIVFFLAKKISVDEFCRDVEKYLKKKLDPIVIENILKQLYE